MANTNNLNEKQKEALKNEQKRARKTGVIFFALAVVFMLVITALDSGYELTGISAILGTIGLFLIGRSYAHVKHKNIDN